MRYGFINEKTILNGAIQRLESFSCALSSLLYLLD
jgi:hypothetical protein